MKGRDKIMELNVGDIVTVTGQIISEKSKVNDKISSKKINFDEPVECIFLGWSTIREGEGGTDSDWGEYDYSPFYFGYFHLEKSIKVAKFARLKYKGNRYYKPISATVDQIKIKE